MHRNGSRLVDISQFLLTMARYGMLISSPLPGPDSGPGISLFSIPPSPALLIVITGGQGELDQSQHYAKNKAKYSEPEISM